MEVVGTPLSTPTPSSLSATSPTSVSSVSRRKRKGRNAAAPALAGSPASASGGDVVFISETAQRDASGGSRRPKMQKVTRACDHCKAKKLRCTGTLPCANCTSRSQQCLYEAAYRRGRPTTPPPAPTGPLPEPTVHHTVSGPSPSASPDDRPASATTRANVVIPQQVNHNPQRPPSESSGRNGDDSGRPSMSRASPELDVSEIEGHYVDPTSNLTFLHRAWKRLASQKYSSSTQVPGAPSAAEEQQLHPQPMMSAGDRPFAVQPGESLFLPDAPTAVSLTNFYFDVCVVTYRCLHQPTVAQWLDILLSNAAQNLPLQQGLGHSRASIVLTIFAIVTLRQEKLELSARVSGVGDSSSQYSLRRSDQYFCAATALTAAETGLPCLESAQARILQVLYLLQTSRMNQAWYVFGSTLPIVSALGLHRKSGGRKRNNNSGSHASSSTLNRTTPTSNGDYVISQCQKRTFWVAYTIDKYLAVVFGRPRLYHDDDIDQDFPDRVNDEDMASQGPSMNEPEMDCHVDSLVFHAKLAQIIDSISRTVYSFKRMPKKERLAAAEKFGDMLHEWRESLPPHLGTVRPKSLMPGFRREATALRLAYCHAIMHANRPFLLRNASQLHPSITNKAEGSYAADDSVTECISAAKMALEMVDDIVADGTIFHALWWTPYVTFCALAVVYVWEIQQRSLIIHQSGQASEGDTRFPGLFELAERCQGHLAQATAADSPSRRYSVILEELRLEARQQGAFPPSEFAPPLLPAAHGDQQMSLDGQADSHQVIGYPRIDGNGGMGHLFVDGPGGPSVGADMYGVSPLLNEWQTRDWLDLDSSAFGPFPDFEGSPVLWMSS